MAFQNRQNHLVIASCFLWLCCLFFLPSMAMAAPTASSFSTSTDEDTALTVDLSAYVTATSPVYYKSTTYKGSVTIDSSTGVAVFTPTANYYGTAAYFKYYVKDATGTSAVAKVSITVTAVNDAPVASAVSTTATEDVYKTVSLSATDVDTASASLIYTVVSAPSNGTLGTPSGRYVRYTPSANYNGTDSFTYSVSDGSLTSNTATVSVTVSAVNDTPTANAGSTSTTEDTPVTVTLSGSDIDGDALTYSIYSATNGSATISGDQATFTPTVDYTGTSAKFTFKANDGTVSSAAATVTVSITAANDAPTAADVSASTSEDTAKTVTLGGSDIDGDTLTYTIVSAPTNGTLGTPTSTSVQYTPSSNYYGSDSFTYMATDPSGLVSNIATATLTVTAVNDAPMVSSFSAPAISEDEVSTVDLTPYASDVEGDALTFSEYAEYKGTVIIDAATGIATFTPTANYNGSLAYFRYRVQDASGTYSSTAKVSYSIAAVNDAPVASDGSGATSEETSTTVTLSATDVESSSLSYRLVSQPTHGIATLSSRTVTYTPETDFSGEDTFTFEAYETATTSSVSNTATVTMAVSAVNDAPTATGVSFETTENVPVVLTLNASDVDGDTLTYTFGTPTGGTVSQTDGVVTYTPNSAYSGTDTFTYTASDAALSASANVTVTVTPNNETPIADGNTATTDEDTAVTITLTGSDAEGEALTYAIASNPANGTVSLSGNSAVYTPNTDSNGSDSFTFTVSDGTNTSAAATVTVTVGSVNDAPVASDVTGSTSENSAVNVTLVATDSDNDALSYLYLYSDHGDVTIDGETMTFTPDTGFGGTATISYRASDGQKASNTATATITVADASNDAPTAEDLSMTMSEDSEKTVTLDASDPEDDAITYAIATEPSYGTLILADDEVLYTPDPDFYGTDSFTYTASDGSATSTAATVALTVIAIPDPVIDCDMTLDPADEQTDATTGVTYWDNLVEVVMDAPATDAQLTELVSTAGGTGEVCKIEQSEMSADEITHLVSGTDTSDTDYGLYRIKISAQASMADIEVVATTLSSLSYVSVASSVATQFEELYAPETDVESSAAALGKAMPDIFHGIQLQGALEYLSKYRSKLASINLAMADTGVCASATYSGWCVSPSSTMTTEFTHFVDSGLYLGELDGLYAIAAASYGTPLADFPFGLVESSAALHGTSVATLLAAESNGSSPAETIFTQDYAVGSGVVGGVPGLEYKVVSYLAPPGVENYTWDSLVMSGSNLTSRIIMGACSSDAVNLSYGIDIGQWQSWSESQKEAHNISAMSISNGCPALYVWGGGNDDYDLDAASFDARSVYYTYGTNDNHIGVQATQNDSTSLSADSNHGSGLSVAAPGNYTSFAAPLVTGTAGLLKAVDSSLSPTELVALLQAGEDTADTGTPFLDTAASVLLAIDGKDDNYVPMTLKFAIYKASQDLATLRETDGYTAGSHNENGLWSLSDNTLTVWRDSVQKSVDAGPQPYQQWIDDDLDSSGTTENENSSVESRLTITNRYQIGLTTAADSNDTSRTIPVLAALPKGQQTVKLEGKFASGGYDEGTGEYAINSLDVGTSYSFQLDYTMNAAESNADGGYRVLLGQESASNGYTVPYNITEAELHGTAVVYAYLQADNCGLYIMPSDAISTGTLVGTSFGTPINFVEFSLENMELPDASTLPVGSGTSTIEEFDSIQFDAFGATEESALYYNDSAYLFYDIDVTFSDFSCTGVQANSSSTGSTDSTTDVTISSEDLILQTFEHHIEATSSSSSTCSVTANYTVTTTVNREYDFYTFNNSDTSTFSETVTWDLTDGVFPVPEVFSFIKMDKPAEHMLNTAYMGYPYFGDNSILPANMIHSGQITPGFGIGMEALRWSHGIGPVKRTDSASKEWELDLLEKLDRSMP